MKSTNMDKLQQFINTDLTDFIESKAELGNHDPQLINKLSTSAFKQLLEEIKWNEATMFFISIQRKKYVCETDRVFMEVENGKVAHIEVDIKFTEYKAFKSMYPDAVDEMEMEDCYR